MLTKPYTPYQDVNQVLNLLLDRVKEVLDSQFTGMYLYGSLSSGDFNLESSDVDFLVVTQGMLPPETISKLDTLHEKLWQSGLKWASKLEGAYVPENLIRHHNPNGASCPTINEGKFYIAPLGSDWIIQRHVVREYGVVIEGPDPKTLIDPVSMEDIRVAILGVLNEWWFPMLDDAHWLKSHESGDRAFAVITMCRVLHALEYGTIVSKPKAVEWAKIKLEKQWFELIDKAVRVYEDKNLDISVNEALDFIRFTMAYVNTNFARGKDDHVS